MSNSEPHNRTPAERVLRTVTWYGIVKDDNVIFDAEGEKAMYELMRDLGSSPGITPAEFEAMGKLAIDTLVDMYGKINRIFPDGTEDIAV